MTKSEILRSIPAKTDKELAEARKKPFTIKMEKDSAAYYAPYIPYGKK